MAELALLGGRTLRNKSFPSWPVFDDQERAAVHEVLESGKWGHVMSPNDKVTAFEKQFATYHGVKYAIAVASGSVALEAALRTAGIGFGDEVLTPPTTWVATNLAPVMVGADPVFVDIEPETYCLDPDKIEPAITAKTKAIIVVHLGGYVCDMDRIMDIARRRNLIVIEDCAQAHGSMYRGRIVGSIGHLGCFSFEATKLMTAGEGGMIITNDDEWAEYGYCYTHAGVRYANQGWGYSKGRIPGWNLRMTEFQAVILMCQLRRLEAHKSKRIENAGYLTKRLADIDGIEPLRQQADQNYYSYMFKYDPHYFGDVPVQTFRDAIQAEGIPCFSSASHQYPAYRSPVFYSPRQSYNEVYCPVAERVFTAEAVGLQATWVFMGDKQDMDEIADAILKIKHNLDELRSLNA
ncbi:MAG: DegT/DnrJ/EryC1/StrS family aminotransferase [Candidatus Entotheonellia bacterium]